MNQDTIGQRGPVEQPLSGRLSLSWKEMFGLACVAIAYWLAIRLGLLFAIQPEGIALIWPASGFALAVLLLHPRHQRARLLAVIFATSATSIWSSGYSLPTSLGFALVNMLEPALDAYVLTFFCKSKITFERTQEVFALLFVAILLNGITALLGAAVSTLAYHGSFTTSWLLWWASNGLGIILVTPFVVNLSAFKRFVLSASSRQILETALLATSLILFAWLFFGSRMAENSLLCGYMFFPLLILLAFRLTPCGMATMLLLFSVIAIWNTVQGNGIFCHANQTRVEHLMSLQVFLTVVTYFGLLLSAIITGRKKTDAALRESQTLLSLFIRHSPIYAFIKKVTSTESRVVHASDNFQQMIGISGSDMVDKTMAELFPADMAAKMTDDDWAVVSHGETLHLDEDFNGRNYTTIKFPIVQGDKTLLAGYTIDITDRKQAEADRRTMEEQLRQSQKMEAIGQLAGGIAHDFNNQLMGIMGYAELLCNRLDDPDLRKDAESILRSSRRASDLTKDLLAFSRKGKFLSIPVNVNKIIEEVISLLKHSIDKRIEVKRILKANPVMISGDPTLIQNALLNLAINAKDALPNGGNIVFTTENARMEDVFRSAEERCNAVKGDYLKVCVVDDGIGIDDETKEHIFEPFFTTKQPGKGTGMGLASVYGTVKSHNGAIHVDSKPGEGTVFSLFFPLLDDKAEAVGLETAPEPSIKRHRILLVDDEEEIRTLLTKVLSSLGHDVVTCKDGLEAVELYRRSWQDIDLVILDIMMPRMSGRDAFLAMKAINKDIKALLISGFSLDGEAQSLLDAGMKGFIHKPFGKKLLSETLEKVLASR